MVSRIRTYAVESGAIESGAVEPGASKPGRARRLEVPEHAADVHAALEGRALGIYTAFRTYGRDRFFGLEEHLNRADQSIRLSGWNERLDRPLLRRALQEAICDYDHPVDELGVRIDVLAPDPDRPERPERPEHANARGLEGRLLITLAPFVPLSPSHREQGVRVELAGELHRQRPKIKNAIFAVERRPYPLNRRDSYDHLLLDERGQVLEATSANVFARIEDQLWTAPSGVLEGITRRFVFACCADLGIEVRQEGFQLAELQAADEAFLSNSTQGIVPVVRVLEATIGKGVPGPWTRDLDAALRRRIDASAEPAWPTPRMP